MFECNFGDGYVRGREDLINGLKILKKGYEDDQDNFFFSPRAIYLASFEFDLIPRRKIFIKHKKTKKCKASNQPWLCVFFS